jgi:NCS1 family nucleobase:cation symporter-1
MFRMNYLFLWLSDGANVGTMQQAASIVSQLKAPDRGIQADSQVALGLSWREAAGAM